MSKFTKEELNERYQKLPQVLKDALYSPETAEKLFAVGRRNGLTIEEIGSAAEEAGYVILGLTRPGFFIDALQKRIDAEEKQIKQLASDINRQVFFPLREALKQAHEFDVSEEAIQKGESLIAGLSKVAPAAGAPRPEPQRPAPPLAARRFPLPGQKPIHPAPQEAPTVRMGGGVPPTAGPAPQPTPVKTPPEPPIQKPAPGAIAPPRFVSGGLNQTITIQPLAPTPTTARPAAPPKQTEPPQTTKPPEAPKPAPQTEPKPVMLTKPPLSQPPTPPFARQKPAPEAFPKSELATPPPPFSKVPPIDLRQQAKPPTPVQPQPKATPYQNTDPYREPKE